MQNFKVIPQHLKMHDSRRLHIGFISFSIMIVTYLHFTAESDSHMLHNIHGQLYLIPLLLGSLLGLKPALRTYVSICFLYFPYLFATSSDSLFITEKLLQLLFWGLFALLSGFIVGREKRQRMELEREKYLANIGKAASAIVHDLKNPLISVRGYAKRIRAGKGDAGDAADVILSAADNMQTIVNDVLDFSRAPRISARERDIRSIVTDAVKACGMKAEDENVTLSPELPHEPVNALCDGSKLERALINFINNAIEASKTGGNVTVTVKKVPGKSVILVEDHGNGMDEETRNSIFIPFYTTKSKGTGLGMAIAKKIIDAHGWKINVISSPHSGTTMEVELPDAGSGENLSRHSRNARSTAETCR